MFCQRSGLPETSGNCSQFVEFVIFMQRVPKGSRCTEPFPFGHTCFPWMVSVGTEGFFAKYSYFLGLNQHLICFLLQ